jgi:hypothetical protein
MLNAIHQWLLAYLGRYLTGQAACLREVQFEVPAHGVAGLEGHTGLRIRCVWGNVWITQDGDERDWILGPGHIFQLQHGGPVLMFGIQASQVTVTE